MIDKRNLGGWAISEELLYHIEQLVPKGSTILELGSGTGTKELVKNYEVYSIEHNKEWVNFCKDSNYIYAPIREYNDYSWYDVSILKNTLPKNYDLIVIDGPPGSIGRIGFLKNIDIFNVRVPIIVDDTNRIREMELCNSLEELLSKKASHYIYPEAEKGYSVL